MGGHGFWGNTGSLATAVWAAQLAEMRVIREWGNRNGGVRFASELRAGLGWPGLLQVDVDARGSGPGTLPAESGRIHAYHKGRFGAMRES